MGGALWGTYDEAGEKNSFQEALREWRGGGESVGGGVGTTPAGTLMRAAAVSGATAHHSSGSLAPSDPGWRPASLQCCWECLQKFTHRGHWSSLASKTFCSRDCGEKYEKSRRLKRAPPPPPKRKAACQRCFNLCFSQETSIPVPESTDKFFCSQLCADLAGVANTNTNTNTSADGLGVGFGFGGSVPSPPEGATRSIVPSGGPPAGRAPRSAAAAGMMAGASVKRSGDGRGGAVGASPGSGRQCPECEGGVDILKGAVGVVIAGLGSRLCCSRKCADAVLARPTPEDSNKENVGGTAIHRCEGN